jgi:hypothetical protein
MVTISYYWIFLLIFSKILGGVIMEDVRKDDERKPYVKPEVIHEMELETRAGSTILPFNNPSLNPLDDLK